MISVSLSPLTTANSSPRSGSSIFLTVYIWLPRWLSILHDDKYHEFLRFRGWCPPPAVAGRPAGPRCTGGLLPQEVRRSPSYQLGDRLSVRLTVPGSHRAASFEVFNF